MFNDKIYPFERNRYYYGKLLTSGDFESEQKYFNDKRRFLNKIMFGMGKVCGLKVYGVDETTIMIESGFALDNQGREIVVDQSSMKKLSVIDGFDQLRKDEMVLCIEYAENPVQPIYSITKNDDGKDYEYNRIHESYRLFLKEYEEGKLPQDIESSLIFSKEIFANPNFKVIINMPTMASTKSSMKIVTKIEKLTDIKENMSLEYVLNIPGFISQSGDEKINVSLDGSQMAKGEVVKSVVYIKSDNTTKQKKSTFMIKKEDVKLIVNGANSKISDNVLFQVDVSDNLPAEIIKSKVKSQSLENVVDSSSNLNKDIELGKISILRSGVGYIIQNVEMFMESVYSVEMPSQVPYINRIMNYYLDNDKNVEVNKTDIKSVNKSDENKGSLNFNEYIDSVIASGTTDIPIGVGVKAGKVVFSDEIMHGLGAGDVCVNVGFEFVTADNAKKNSLSKKIVLGDPEVFKDEGIGMSSVKTAVQVFCEKGTFKIGLKFAEATNIVSVKARWFAYRKFEVGPSGLVAASNEKSIHVKQDTVTLVPNEVHFIEVGFKNMNPTAVRYEVLDKDGGEVDGTGVYTAPSKEGVYEIKISCVNEPSIYTFAYAIVMKKDVEK